MQTNKSLKELWEERAEAYNNIFIFLCYKNLSEKDLKQFTDLLKKYISLL